MGRDGSTIWTFAAEAVLIITEAFDTLKAAGCVTSQREFSVVWLGRKPSYVSSMTSRAATRTPGTDVLLTLYSRLRHHTEDTAVDRPELGRLAERIWYEIMDRVSKRKEVTGVPQT